MLSRRLTSRSIPIILKSAPLPVRKSFATSKRIMSSQMKKITTEKAFPVAGPYTQAIVANGLVYVSGQIPGEPNGDLVEGSIAAKTAACCENIKAILAEAGSEIGKVVKTTVFLDDMANFAEMNETYEKYFAHRPSRSCVAVKQLPKGVPVEIECVALA